MDLNKKLSPQNPSTTKRPSPDPDSANPLRSVSNSTKNEGELISSNTPMDANVGRSNTIKASITAAIASPQQLASTINYELKHNIKRSASSELLKIENLDDYRNACAAYKWALKEGWSEERVLAMIGDWQKMDGKRERW
ncbi:hypothetical protein EJ02DRAFT_458609 [Clathrospora elynae]|uniref:Uncharacterized protein n=1 Tax=Clathrospora elynae TaxID=706981 RepID=A0A6A5SDJ4_9PLEO|nr:hypothetical protein EJ02DRAFT_458609 [Clathrospora elynae]